MRCWMLTSQDTYSPARLPQPLQKCSEAYPFGGPIKWNFDHFLVSRTGNVIARWEGAADLLAAQQIAAIEHALKQKTPAGKKARDCAFVGSQKLRPGSPPSTRFRASAVDALSRKERAEDACLLCRHAPCARRCRCAANAIVLHPSLPSSLSSSLPLFLPPSF